MRGYFFILFLFLSGCGGFSASDLKGLATDARSVLQQAQAQGQDYQNLKNSIQQLLIKLNTVSSMGIEQLRYRNVDQISTKLSEIMQQISGTATSLNLSNRIHNIPARFPYTLRRAWPIYIYPQVYTLGINVQAAYLTGLLQYMYNTAPLLKPKDVKPLTQKIATLTSSLSALNV